MATQTTPKARRPKPAAPPPPIEEHEEETHDEPIDLNAVDWNALLAGLAGGGGQVYYPKQGRTNLRLMPPKTKEVFVPVTAWYQGQARTKYIVAAWGKLGGQGSEDNVIRAVLVPRRTVQSILGMQVEGWDLFGADRGFPIALVKSGNVTNVIVAPKPVRIPEEVLTEYEDFDIHKVAEDWSAFQEQRAKNPQAAQEALNKAKAASGEEPAEEEGEDW